MGSIIQAKVLWVNDTVNAYCNISQPINCERLDLLSAKPVWIVRPQGCGSCGNGGAPYLTFQNPNDANALSGVWIEDGYKGLVIDAADTAALVTACNCTSCGDNNMVTPVYNGVIPDPTAATLSTFCLTRAGNGTWLDINNASLAYMGKYKQMQHLGTSNGVDKYQIQAYNTPYAVGADTIVAGACA